MLPTKGTRKKRQKVCDQSRVISFLLINVLASLHTKLLQPKQPGAMRGIVEDVRSSCVDRNGTSVRGLVRRLASVECERLKVVGFSVFQRHVFCAVGMNREKNSKGEMKSAFTRKSRRAVRFLESSVQFASNSTEAQLNSSRKVSTLHETHADAVVGGLRSP